MQRWFNTITIMGLLSACAADDVPAENGGSTTNPGGTEGDAPDLPSDETTTTGAPDPVCGDGVVDPGEDCDDGNEHDDDGCLASCELGPCAWEWVRREPALTNERSWLVLSPMALDADGPWIAHQTDPEGERGTRLLHAGTDGSSLTSHDLDLTPGDDYIYGVALDSSGDVFLGHARFAAETIEIRRIQPDGGELWVHSHDSFGYLAGLELAANADLILVTSTEVSATDRDVLIVAIDPADGNERWMQTYSGAVAGNGYSFDYGAGLALDEQGRRYVSINEYVDWDTVAPVVAAYAPGDSGEPLWVTRVVDMPLRSSSPEYQRSSPDGSVSRPRLTCSRSKLQFQVSVHSTVRASWTAANRSGAGRSGASRSMSGSISVAAISTRYMRSFRRISGSPSVSSSSNDVSEESV
jgi:cysteine-rich repeat protein